MVHFDGQGQDLRAGRNNCSLTLLYLCLLILSFKSIFSSEHLIGQVIAALGTVYIPLKAVTCTLKISLAHSAQRECWDGGRMQLF